MKQSQRRYFRESACDCPDCTSVRGGLKQAGYMVLVFTLLGASFAVLIAIAKVLSLQIVK